jgi:hypothetical protein
MLALQLFVNGILMLGLGAVIQRLLLEPLARAWAAEPS